MGNQITSIERMGNHKNDAQVQAEGCAALAKLAMDEANKDKIRTLRGIEMIVQAMRIHENDARVQAEGCEALAKLAMDEADKISTLGGIAKIVQAMRIHTNDARVQAVGCVALQNLAYNNDANRVKIRTQEGIKMIVQAMRIHENDALVQTYGCAALWNLADNNDANRVKIRTLEGIEMIVQAMRIHENDARVQAVGCVALCILAYNNDANKDKISTQGGIEMIEQAMRNHENDADVQTNGCEALANLAKTEEDHIIETIDTLFSFKIVLTLLTYQYKTNNLSSFDEYKKYVFKALEHTAKTCISEQRNEVGPFVNCLDYAIEKKIINNTEKENLKAKATNCEVNQRIDEVNQRIDNLEKQLENTQNCLMKMQQQYNNNLKIRKGIAFTKRILNILTFGLGGDLTEAIISSGLINVIDFGNIEHVQSVINSDSISQQALAHFNNGLEYANRHFHNNLDKSIAEVLDEFKRNANTEMQDNEGKLCSELGCFLKVSQMLSEVKDPRAPSVQSVTAMAQNKTNEVKEVLAKVINWVADYNFIFLWLLVILWAHL